MEHHLFPQYSLRDKEYFQLSHYNWAKPFSSFLPGIAGRTGKPLWAFYVNRGQAMCSIGIRDKDHQIMEFTSMNRAMRLTGLQGFRTFIKIDGGKIYEPFSRSRDCRIRQQMTISSHELSINDYHEETSLETTVTYFQLPEEQCPALLRNVHITNRGKKEYSLELIDGLPLILPYGMDRNAVSGTPRHSEGLMKVYDIDGLPFYRLKIDPEDKPLITLLSGAYFYFTYDAGNEHISRDYLVDPRVIFGSSTEFSIPFNFQRENLETILRNTQVRHNKTPSAFTAFHTTLPPGETFTFFSLVGYADGEDTFRKFVERVSQNDYCARKREQNRAVIREIRDRMLTVSSSEGFDGYCGQTFLDNVIRGGLPVVVTTADGENAFYLYSRQNGDLERDYHDFVLEPSFYSQGNGHYRCIIQNRRMDNYFVPRITDSNIRFFLNAMQLDGYNPIEVRSTTYSLADRKGFSSWLESLPPVIQHSLRDSTTRDFMPGTIVEDLVKAGLTSREAITTLHQLLAFSRQNTVIDLHPRLGFWLDHWCYNMDLIESYLRIFPDALEAMLFDDGYTFYDSPDFVLPREKRYILANGAVRQYESVFRDGNKAEKLQHPETRSRQVRTARGTGGIYRTNLVVKLLTLITNRMGTLDPEGIGCEMEANKPGWNDSINGLPGILGSSICHSLQLRRFCSFLHDSLDDTDRSLPPTVMIFEELYDFIQGLIRALDDRLADNRAESRYRYWDASHTVKEVYRERVRNGITGAEKELSIREIRAFLRKCITLLDGIVSPEHAERVFNSDGIPYTYFVNSVTEWEETGCHDDSGRPFVHARRFTQRPLPLFLEGPVHFIKVYPAYAARLYTRIRASVLFDEALKTYRNNASLEEESYEIGRIKAWGRGWLENESIYTHMLFKYLLEILRAGLYEEFFEELSHSLMPFLTPHTYGRNIMENVSFIVSSAFTDSTMHGNGLQARLSGSTCEFIHMWTIICSGHNPFHCDETGILKLTLHPLLPAWLFTSEERTVRIFFTEEEETELRIPRDCFACRFLRNTILCYHNPDRIATWKARVVSYSVHYHEGETRAVAGAVLDNHMALDVRNGRVARIDVFLKQQAREV